MVALDDHSDADKHEWVWEYQDNDLSMQVDDEIRFRVVEEVFVDTSPTNGTTATHTQHNLLMNFNLFSPTET